MNIETTEQTEARLARHTADTFAAIFGLARKPADDFPDELPQTAQPIAPEVQP